MQRYEYKVILAPARGEKARGLKTTGEKFAHTLTAVMNEMAAEGWDYLRADTLPCEERSGLTGRVTTYQNLLVFRRLTAASMATRLQQESPVSATPSPAVEAPAVPAAPAVDPAPGNRGEDFASSLRRNFRALRSGDPEGSAPKLGTADGAAETPLSPRNDTR